MQLGFSLKVLVLTLAVVVAIIGGPGALVMADEATCSVDGTCTTTDQRRMEPNCKDDNDECSSWASQGECDANPNYMLKSCRKSCFVCGTIQDENELPADASDLGVAQSRVTDGFATSRGQFNMRITRARRYMEDTQVTLEAKEKCQNYYADCTNWAIGNECAANQMCK